MLLRIGETIDRYRIEALVGQGGMAAVYRVRHTQLDSEHALKVLFITAPKVINRLLREGRVQANLRHPNIVSVTDTLYISDAPALVMEYIDGPALDSWLLENRPTLEEALWLFRGILRGMAAAHERGVVHRDLKPANVLLSPTDEGLVPKVTDFGLVKSVVEQRGDTMAGMTLGTPEYMSPEQIRDASDIDQRADMWALGCVLYELVCNRRAFQGVDKMSTFNQIVAGTYEAPRKLVDELPRNVSEAIRLLLEVDREKRLSSCEELFELLYQKREIVAGRITLPPRPVLPLQLDPLMASVAPLARRSAAQLAVPTGEPAARREYSPRTSSRRPSHGRNHEFSRQPATSPTVAPRATGVSRRFRIPLALTFVMVAVSGFAASSLDNWVVDRPPSLADSVIRPTPVTAPVVVGFTPRSWYEDADNELEVDQQVTGRVRVVGDAREVWLLSGGRRHDPTTPLAAGSYQIVAQFGETDPIDAGNVEVPAGDELTLTCMASVGRCRAL